MDKLPAPFKAIWKILTIPYLILKAINDYSRRHEDEEKGGR